MRIAMLLATILALSGCGGARCPTTLHTDARTALDMAASMRAPARVMRAEARVDRRDAEGRVRGTVLMIVERPERVRFDVMTQFGPAAILTSDGSSFALTDLREDRYFHGPPCAENIERLLGLPLGAEEVGLLLFGLTPTIEASEEQIVCDGGSYRVTLRATDGRRQELVLAVRQADVEAPIEEQRMRLRSTEVFTADGALEWRVTFDDHRFVEDPATTATPREGIAMPYRIRFEMPSRGIDTLVRFERIELNTPVVEGTFTQTPRPGLSIEQVECGGP